MGSIRIERLQARVQELVARILSQRLQDPRLELVTVTRVEVTSDTKYAKVYVSSPNDEPADVRRILRAFGDARGRIQEHLGKALDTRNTPILEFLFDEGLKKQMRMQRILRELAEERGEVYDPVPDYEVVEDADEPDAEDAVDTEDAGAAEEE